VDKYFKHGLISVSLILVVLIPLVIIAAPVFATSATPPDNYVLVQQGGVFLLRGSVTFDQAAIGSFSWGPVGWYHYGDPTDNFSLENTPSVYWSDGTPVENVSISEEETASAHSITIADNGSGIERNGTFYIDVWLRAASGDGTLHKAKNQWITFAMDMIFLFEPGPMGVSAGPIYVDVTGAYATEPPHLKILLVIVVAVIATCIGAAALHARRRSKRSILSCLI